MRDPAPWQKRYHRLLLLALVYGLWSQYLFVNHSPGISVLLFVLGFYGVLFYGVKGRIGGLDQWRGQTRSGWLLFIPIGLLSLSYAIFANELFRTLNAIVLPLMLLAQTVLLTRSSERPWYRVRFYDDVLQFGIARPLIYCSVPFSLLKELRQAGEAGEVQAGNLRKISMGLVLASPLLIVVTALLASADTIFHTMLASIPNLAEGLPVGELFARVLITAVIAMYTFCYIWGLLFHESKSAPAAGSGQQRIGAAPARSDLRLDPVTAAALLISVNVVYVLFAVIQFTYLFGAADGLLPAGAEYAAYARRGFSELVIVAVINLGLLMLGLHGIQKAGKTLQRIIKLALALIVGCTIIMLISAYSRLALYEQAYGYTMTRLLVHGFMLLLGVMLIIAWIRVGYNRFSLAKAYIATAVIAFTVMNFANLDARIADNNMARYEVTQSIDMHYLSTRSADAAPAIARFAKKHPELTEAASIAAQLREEANRDQGWQSWNWSKWKAANS